MKSSIPIITIDGPGGTGKGTAAQLLAQKLGWHFLDSGTLYRVLALAAEHKHQIDLTNEHALHTLAAHLDVQFKPTELGQSPQIILEGEDVTSMIRTEECGKTASVIAVLPKVRDALLERQRAFLELPGLVAEGRDMGTIVFPEATLKIFLDATPSVRAHRRYLQLKKRGIDASLSDVFAELKQRDERDRNREVAPLTPAKDALIIDTSSLTVEAVLGRILEAVRNCFKTAVF